MTLFEMPGAARPPGSFATANEPLASRLRPRTLDELVGHRSLIGEGTLLRRLIEQRQPGSLLFWGPPGSGKSTLALLIAHSSGAYFENCSAVMAGVADIRRILDAARRRASAGAATLLFIDEIHRFNKAQQDSLLPAVEAGVVTLIGATTENPYFSINTPLLSRLRVVRLDALTRDDLHALIRRALTDCDRGIGELEVTLTSEAEELLIERSGGDARFMLNALESAARAAEPDDEGKRQVTAELAAEALQQRVLDYDRQGDQHYDVVSAWIKSIRGSDPDAAIYWLHRMLNAGEDPRFICRRLLIHASEDIGLADSGALSVAMAAAYALEHAGMPEAQIPITHATLYLASAPKSNSVVAAIGRVRAELEKQGPGRVPAHLRDSHYAGARILGHGEGYIYPHDLPGSFVRQQYLPDEAAGCRFYMPGDSGDEAGIAERLRLWRDGLSEMDP